MLINPKIFFKLENKTKTSNFKKSTCSSPTPNPSNCKTENKHINIYRKKWI